MNRCLPLLRMNDRPFGNIDIDIGSRPTSSVSPNNISTTTASQKTWDRLHLHPPLLQFRPRPERCPQYRLNTLPRALLRPNAPCTSPTPRRPSTFPPTTLPSQHPHQRSSVPTAPPSARSSMKTGTMARSTRSTRCRSCHTIERPTNGSTSPPVGQPVRSPVHLPLLLHPSRPLLPRLRRRNTWTLRTPTTPRPIGTTRRSGNTPRPSSSIMRSSGRAGRRQRSTSRRWWRSTTF